MAINDSHYFCMLCDHRLMLSRKKRYCRIPLSQTNDWQFSNKEGVASSRSSPMIFVNSESPCRK
jgi:hypothetical protein